MPGKFNRLHKLIAEKVFLPPLHLKLGLMKNFVKAMDQNGADFLANEVPRHCI